MRLSLLFIALLVTSCTRGGEIKAPPPSIPVLDAKVVEITDSNYAKVVEGQKVVLIMFWAPWSAPDRQMTPRIEAIAKDYGARVTTGKVDVDESPALANKFAIKGIPTMVVLKDGKEQERVVGLAPQKTIADLLDKQLNTDR